MQKKDKKELMDIYWQRFLLGGDREEAFAHIYQLTIHDLLSYGHSLGVDKDTCEDAAHDVFYHIFLDAKHLYQINNINVYLFGSFRHALINMSRKHSKIQDTPIEEIPFFTDITVLSELINHEERILLKKRVEQLLALLTPRQREAIYLRYMQNMDYEDIAQLFQMNNASVRKLVYRAINSMRKEIVDVDVPFIALLLLGFSCGGR